MDGGQKIHLPIIALAWAAFMASMASLNSAMVSGRSTAGSPPTLEELAQFPAGTVPERIAATQSAVFDVDVRCSSAA